MSPPDAEDSVLAQLLKIAIDLDADMLDMEPDDGLIFVYVRKGNTGVSIASLDPKSPEAKELWKDLNRRKRKKSRVRIDGTVYSLKVEAYDTFDETGYQVWFKTA